MFTSSARSEAVLTCFGIMLIMNIIIQTKVICIQTTLQAHGIVAVKINLFETYAHHETKINSE